VGLRIVARRQSVRVRRVYPSCRRRSRTLRALRASRFPSLCAKDGWMLCQRPSRGLLEVDMMGSVGRSNWPPFAVREWPTARADSALVLNTCWLQDSRRTPNSVSSWDRLRQPSTRHHVHWRSCRHGLRVKRPIGGSASSLAWPTRWRLRIPFGERQGPAAACWCLDCVWRIWKDIGLPA
jgi:hypothetical protein